MDPRFAAQRIRAAVGLPAGVSGRQVRRARGPGARRLLPPNTAAVRLRRRRLQNKGLQALSVALELETAPVHLHILRPLGLHQTGQLPRRVALDPVLLRRPDHTRLELAVPPMHLHSNRALTLRYVRVLPPER